MSIKPRTIGLQKFNELQLKKDFPVATRSGTAYNVSVEWEVAADKVTELAPKEYELLRIKNLPAPYNLPPFDELICAGYTISPSGFPGIVNLSADYVPAGAVDNFNDDGEEWSTNSVYKETWLTIEDIRPLFSPGTPDDELAAELKILRDKGKGTKPSAEIQLVHTKANSGNLTTNNIKGDIGEIATPPGVGNPPTGFKWIQVARNLHKVEDGEKTETNTYQLFDERT